MTRTRPPTSNSTLQLVTGDIEFSDFHYFSNFPIFFNILSLPLFKVEIIVDYFVFSCSNDNNTSFNLIQSNN